MKRGEWMAADYIRIEHFQNVVAWKERSGISGKIGIECWKLLINFKRLVKILNTLPLNEKICGDEVAW